MDNGHSEYKRIVVVGGGFAGVTLALKLAKQSGFSITLIDKNNYNFFPPLLYQVATGFLEVSNISYPFRKLFRSKKNLRFILAEFYKVIPGENKIETSSGAIEYDYIVFATGTQTNYFGMENVKNNAIPMKTISDALEMRNHLLLQMEKATRTTDAEEQKKLLTVVIAGAGPTGVEISGMMAELKKGFVVQEYPELTVTEGKIYLVDAGPAVLGPMSKQSQTETLQALQKLGVEVLLNKQVKDYVNESVLFADGESIKTTTLIWASGVTGMEITGIDPVSVGRGRRLLVNAYNKVNNYENIYAIGDICLQTTDNKFPNGHPQLAQVAIQQSKNLARNFLLQQMGKSPRPFKYTDNGSMAIIGIYKAVADLPKSHFKGFIAWFLWIVVHLFSLLRGRNRAKTFSNWVIALLTKDQALRFIIRPGNRK